MTSEVLLSLFPSLAKDLGRVHPHIGPRLPQYVVEPLVQGRLRVLALQDLDQVLAHRLALALRPLAHLVAQGDGDPTDLEVGLATSLHGLRT